MLRLIIALTLIATPAFADDPPPNIIMIMADDLGYGDVGFNGNSVIQTPALDRLASEGLVFDRFYAAAPICSPTRGSSLTGRHPFRYGILSAHTGGMRAGERTIAEILGEQGYATGFFGKWHLGYIRPDAEQDDRGYYSPPWHHGFDRTFATKSAVPTWNPSVTPPGWNRWGNYEGALWGSSIYLEDGEMTTENLKGDDSRVIMDRALPFAEQAVANDKPFFMCIWFHTPHEPVVAGKEYRDLYPDASKEAQHYYGSITAMDEQIGRLMETLEKLGIADETIIWFTSDNGPSGHHVKESIASAGPYRGSKHTVYEGGLRVPTVLTWPGRIEPGSTSYLSGTVDQLPTLLTLAEINADFDERPMDGIDLSDAIFKGATERPGGMGLGWMRLHEGIDAVVWQEGRYKLIKKRGKGRTELYDLQADPAESNNLASDIPDQVREMSQTLREWEASCQLSRDGGDYRF